MSLFFNWTSFSLAYSSSKNCGTGAVSEKNAVKKLLQRDQRAWMFSPFFSFVTTFFCAFEEIVYLLLSVRTEDFLHSTYQNKKSWYSAACKWQTCVQEDPTARCVYYLEHLWGSNKLQICLKTTEPKSNYGKDCLKEAVLNLTLAIFSLLLPLWCLITAAKNRLCRSHSAQFVLMQTLTYTQLSGLV